MDPTTNPFDQALAPFLYSSNIFVEWGVICLVALLTPFPRYLTGLVVILQFIRLNERLPLSLSIPTYAYVFLMFSLVLHCRRLFNYRLKKEDWALTLFVGWIIGETILFNRYNLSVVLFECGLGLVFYFTLLIFMGDKKGFILLNWALLISATFICAEPLYYHFTEPAGSPVLAHFIGITGRLKAWGMWGNANETSFIACLGTTNVLLLMATGKLKYVKMFLMAPLLIMFLMMIAMTASRTGFGCVAIIFISVGVFSRKFMMRILAIALMIGGLFLAPAYIESRRDLDGSSSERFDLRYAGRHLFLQHPVFGVGYGESHHETGGMMIHSTFIQAFAETGFFGGMLFVFFFYEISRNLILELKNGWSSKTIAPFNAILIGAFTASVVYYYFGNQLLTTMFFAFSALIKISLNFSRNMALNDQKNKMELYISRIGDQQTG
jgi:hypothetical protein